MTTQPKLRIARVLTTAILAAGLAISAVGASYESPTDATTPSPAFGCPGTMVIANIDCQHGVAEAFDKHQMNDTTRYGCKGSSPHLAPWCTYNEESIEESGAASLTASSTERE